MSIKDMKTKKDRDKNGVKGRVPKAAPRPPKMPRAARKSGFGRPRSTLNPFWLTATTITLTLLSTVWIYQAVVSNPQWVTYIEAGLLAVSALSLVIAAVLVEPRIKDGRTKRVTRFASTVVMLSMVSWLWLTGRIEAHASYAALAAAWIFVVWVLRLAFPSRARFVPVSATAGPAAMPESVQYQTAQESSSRLPDVVSGEAVKDRMWLGEDEVRPEPEPDLADAVFSKSWAAASHQNGRAVGGRMIMTS